MAKANLTKVANIDAAAREIDFVTRFGTSWDSLREILGIMRPLRKTPGTTLKAYTADITLQPGNVGEGEEIPYSQANVKPVYFQDIVLEKYAKAVSIEAVNTYGAEIAVQKTDDAFLNQLQSNILDNFYTFLQNGTLVSEEANFQMGVAMAIGKVRDKFKKMRKGISRVAVFVNTLDAYRYLGGADISIQSMFGIEYVENFLGAGVMVFSSEIPQGKIIATPVDNILLYYVDPSDAQFGQLGLDYRVQGETNLIGVHVDGNYSTAVGEVFALTGMTLWAEYLDGIAIVTIPSTITIDTASVNKTTVAADNTATVAVSGVTYTATPATAPTLAYQWQVRAKNGYVWTDLTSDYTGYNTDTLTVKAADAGKHYRCRVTATGSATGIVYTDECTVQG